ncbi:MAG: DUF488 domain-containing protein [Candidatus Binataceae bacterium]
MIRVKRAYEPAAAAAGAGILVDRVWPRGVKKESLKISKWMKEIAPSAELRKFFGHQPERWDEFRKRYRAELAKSEQRARLAEIAKLAAQGTITLIYGARDEQHNQAVVLKEALDSLR